MKRLPPILEEGRWMGLVCITAVALAQAGTMVVTAFATRDIVAVLRVGEGVLPQHALLSLIGAGIAMFVLCALEGAVAERTGQSYAAAIRRKLFMHMSRMPISAVAERRAGALALRYVGDLNALKGWVSKGIARLISAAITIPAALAILYVVHPSLAVGAAIPLAGAILLILWLGAPLAAAHAQVRSERASIAASMSERLPQAPALRRTGRLKTELRALDDRSQAIARAATYRAWLAEAVRGLPEVASGTAAAACLWICFTHRLPVEDAVVALTGLALVIWPLRKLAEVRDRQKAFTVAAEKLDATLSGPTMSVKKRRSPRADAPALEVSGLTLRPDTEPLTFSVARGQSLQLSGSSDVAARGLLTVIAGLDKMPSGRIRVLGLPPTAVPAGRVLYLGRHAPQLRGTLRRECTIGIGRSPDDGEITSALRNAGLMEMHNRLGGLSGRVAEGRRNLTSTEIAGIHLVRGLLSKPDLALIDAGEINLSASRLNLLLAHLDDIGAAVVLLPDPGARGEHGHERSSQLDHGPIDADWRFGRCAAIVDVD